LPPKSSALFPFPAFPWTISLLLVLGAAHAQSTYVCGFDIVSLDVKASFKTNSQSANVSCYWFAALLQTSIYRVKVCAMTPSTALVGHHAKMTFSLDYSILFCIDTECISLRLSLRFDAPNKSIYLIISQFMNKQLGPLFIDHNVSNNLQICQNTLCF
jgi:hypothetical protein